MSDASEPNTGELSRMLALMRDEQRDFRREVNARIDRLATAESLDGERRRVDERLKDLADDIAAEAKARKEGDTALALDITKAFEGVGKRLDSVGVWVRALLVGLLVPVALFVATMLMQRS